MQSAHFHPIVSPTSNEALAAYLERAANAYRWPTARREEDLRILAALAELLPSAEAMLVAAHLIRALSFAADSSMALRLLDRYVRRVEGDAAGKLRSLRDNSEHLHFLSSFFAFSHYLGEVAVAHPEYLEGALRGKGLRREKTFAAYESELRDALAGTEPGESRRVQLVLFKQRELLRIGMRDLLELANTQELCRELSCIAQAILHVSYLDILSAATARFGQPNSEEDGRVAGVCIYAMGKFGAGELNFSSDIDLVFVYEAEGTTEGVEGGLGGSRIRRVSNHEYFNWFARELSIYLDNRTGAGFLYRVDLRLRPEGDNGPLARSRAAYVAYLVEQAALWEKIAYVKAHCIEGDRDLAARFDQVIQQFVYAGNSGPELFDEVARLKRRIDFERLGEEERELDIKRGRGGIREIEFIVAGQQVKHGESNVALRVKPTLVAMKLLVQQGLMDQQLARRLEEAYHLFRRIEHTLQMMFENQTHRMPPVGLERERLALRCGFARHDEFERVLGTYRCEVRAEFDRLYGGDSAPRALTLEDVLFGDGDPSRSILAELAPAGLDDDAGFLSLRRLAVGSSDFSPSTRGRIGFRKLLPLLLEELPRVAQPRTAVHQFDQLLRAAHGFRWIYELCLLNPMILRLILRTLGFGSLLGRQLIAHPEWLDEMLSSDGLKDSRTAAAMARFAAQPPRAELEEALRQLRAFKQLEAFLLCVQEVLAVITSQEAAERMAALATFCLEALRQIAERELGAVEAPWAIIGLGGLGDGQVHANGDLDIAFVIEDGNPEARDQAERVCQFLLREMSALTPQGQLWKVDARLRPDGRSGPLLATRQRFLEYYQAEAGLWEWQVLTKGRGVAGDVPFATQLLDDLQALYRSRPKPFDLGAQILQMKQRIESNFTLPRTATVDLKRSPGGVVDIEFLAQFLLLDGQVSGAWHQLTTEQVLSEASIPSWLLDHLALLRTIQRFHRVLSETSNDYFPADDGQRAALRRGLADQLGPAVSRLGDLEAAAQRVRALVLAQLTPGPELGQSR
jgi:glutamate-ammonia-ligase adenylyltransferase